MLNVFLTIDTETYPQTAQWRSCRLERELAVDIYGITAAGEYGLRYQLQMLNRFGLKASFFVEGLFASVVGLDPLKEIVQTIVGSGHDVQLHIQPEWLAWMVQCVVKERRGDYMTLYPQAEQAAIIAEGASNLHECGIREVKAFRAGDFAANLNTIRALQDNNIAYDTSYNASYLNTTCQLDTGRVLLQPVRIGQVCEIPVTFFVDWLGRRRHMQLTACSSSELENALLYAYRYGYYSCVIVSHSFELIKRRWRTGRPPAPDAVVVGRFERLCRFLAENGDKFRTCTFAELEPGEVPHDWTVRPLRSTMLRTAFRYAEQIARRLHP